MKNTGYILYIINIFNLYINLFICFNILNEFIYCYSNFLLSYIVINILYLLYNYNSVNLLTYKNNK